MNCDQATELLPWLLNGTLDPGDRDEVRRHLTGCGRCREALSHTQEAWRIFDQHLPAEALVALAYGEAPADLDPALAERHLASCPQCAAELEMAGMSRHLEEEDRIALFPGRARQQEPRGTRVWRATALAASFAGLVAVAGWIHSVQQSPSGTQLAEQERGRAGNTQIADAGIQPPQAARFFNVSPQDAVLRNDSSRQVTEIPEGVSQPVLVLGASKTSSFPEYEVEIQDERGNPVSTIQGLQLDSNGFYALLLPKGSLEPGSYKLRVFGVAGDRREALETYSVRQR